MTASPSSVDSASPATLEAVLAILARSLRQAPRLTADSDVFQLGADSMVMMGVVAQLEQHFSMEFEPEHLVKELLFSARSIATLIDRDYKTTVGASS